MDAEHTHATVVPDAGGETAAAVLAIWREVLDDPGIASDEDFFGAGGHSLLAVQLAERLSEELGVEVPVALVFLHPTPAELADALQGS